MELRPLGSTGMLVSPVGLGTVKLGRAVGLKHPTPASIPDDDEARRLLHAARDLGVNVLDTAPAYGNSEERLGALLKGDRDRWIISTKGGEEFEGGVSRFDFTPAALLASAERSLRRLGTDHVDVFLLHSDGLVEAGLDESGVTPTLRAIKQRGMARAVGVSVKTLRGAVACVERFDVVMLTLSPVETDALPAVDLAQRRGVGVMVKKALASGHMDRLARTLPSDAARADPVGHALRFVLGTAGVSTAIVGTTSPDHLAQCCRSLRPD